MNILKSCNKRLWKRSNKFKEKEGKNLKLRVVDTPIVIEHVTQRNFERCNKINFIVMSIHQYVLYITSQMIVFVVIYGITTP